MFCYVKPLTAHKIFLNLCHANPWVIRVTTLFTFLKSTHLWQSYGIFKNPLRTPILKFVDVGKFSRLTSVVLMRMTDLVCGTISMGKTYTWSDAIDVTHATRRKWRDARDANDATHATQMTRRTRRKWRNANEVTAVSEISY